MESVEEEEEGAQHPTLWCTDAQGEAGGDPSPRALSPGSAGERVLDLGLLGGRLLGGRLVAAWWQVTSQPALPPELKKWRAVTPCPRSTCLPYRQIGGGLRVGGAVLQMSQYQTFKALQHHRGQGHRWS